MADLQFGKFPVSIDYLDPNIWFSTRPPTSDTSTGNVDKGVEVAQITAETLYYMSATVQNNSTIYSRPALVHFFFTEQAPQPRLLGSPQSSSQLASIPGDPPNNYYLYNGGSTIFFQPGHLCLVGVLQEYISDPNNPLATLPEANKYVDAAGNAIPNVPVDRADRLIAQHNIDIVPPPPIPLGNRISHFGSVNLYGLADRSVSSLVLRAPGRIELDAIRATISPTAKLIHDVTGETVAGFFDSEPSPDSLVDDEELKKLPLEIVIKGLEPGCKRKIYWGVKLTDDCKGAEDMSAAFMLLEQVTEKKEVLGGVVVVAVSQDIPVPDSGG